MILAPETLTAPTLLPQLVITATNDLQCINIAQGHYFRSGGRGTKREETPVGRVCRVQNTVRKLQFHLWRENPIVPARSNTFEPKQDIKVQKTL